MGAIAGAVNVAIADNDTRNEAKLLGAASADNVFVEAWLQSGAPVSSQPPGKGRVSSPGTVRCSFVKNENWLPVPMFTSGASRRPCPAPRKLA